MSNKRGTKRALLTSILAICLCLVMLIGSTFAWFTDTASTSVSKIQAGNLDVELLLYKDAETSYENISKDKKPIFSSEGSTVAQNNNLDTLWEPGKTQIAYLAIKNEGNLALKYKVALNVKNPDDGKELYKVMQYAIAPDAEGGKTPAPVWTGGSGVTLGQQVVTSDVPLAVGATHYFALLVHMDENAGNDYMNGKVEFDLTVYATQNTVENDSYGPDYDKDAEYSLDIWNDGTTVAVLNGEGYSTLEEAIEKAAAGDTIILLANVEVPENYTIDKDVTIRSAQGQHEIKGLKSISNVQMENIYLNLTSTLTIGDDTILSNCTVRAKDLHWRDARTRSGVFDYDDINNYAYSYLVKVIGNDVTMTGCAIDGRPSDDSYFEDMCLMKMDSQNATLTNCSFHEGTNAIANSSPAGTLTLDGCKFSNIYTDALEVKNSDNDPTIIIRNSELIASCELNDKQSNIIFENCTFKKGEDYESCYYGLNVYGPLTTFTNCSFSEEYLTKEDNHGIYAGKGAVVEMNGCMVPDGYQVSDVVNTDYMGSSSGFAAIDVTKDADGNYTSGTFAGNDKSSIEKHIAEGCTLIGGNGVWTVVNG